MYKQVEAIQTLLKNSVWSLPDWVPLKKIKKFIKGDPVLIPVASLPALTIRATAANVSPRDNIRDQRVYNIQIRYIFDIRNTMGGGSSESVEFEKEANNIFIQEKETNDDLENFCILSILRQNQNINWTAKLSKDFSLNAEYTQIRGYLAYEVAMTFQVTNIWK
jgi:hypothetical protein